MLAHTKMLSRDRISEFDRLLVRAARNAEAKAEKETWYIERSMTPSGGRRKHDALHNHARERAISCGQVIFTSLLSAGATTEELENACIGAMTRLIYCELEKSFQAADWVFNPSAAGGEMC